MNNDIIERALATLNAGGTLLYPTDTIWGIGCDAVNPTAVERVYAIKERDHSKSMLLESERPTTVVLPACYVVQPLPDNLLAADGTVGVRVPKMDFCQELLRQFGHPIVSTSANFSGRPSPQCYADIEDELKRRVDYCLPDDPVFHHPATGSSRILKVNPDGSVAVIRS